MSDSSDSEREDYTALNGTKRAPQPTRLGRTAKGGGAQKRKRPEENGKEELPEGAKKYIRGKENVLKGIKDKKLKSRIENEEAKYKEAIAAAARAEILHTEEAGYLEAEGMERTYKFKQNELLEHVDLNTRAKKMELKMDSGPYSIDYTRNGRHLLLGGRKGHLSVIDSLRTDIVCEFNVKDTVKDVKFLHNETMFAVAQKKYLYIYDNTGLELHCLRDHLAINRLEFLPYHFLLCTVGETGFLRYQDTSTGKLVAEHRTKLGPCRVMRANSWNGVIHLGHGGGVVTMWTPNMSTPVVKMLCHRGPVQALAMDRSGQYMATAGLDGQMKIWDIRTYKEVSSYFTTTPASTLDISQQGLLAVGYGPNVQVWKDAIIKKAKAPYMTHRLPSKTVQDVLFRPFDDILGVGHSEGFCTMIVPGAGEPNYDAMEANPFETTKQRRETEVVSLLEKLQPEMISLNPNLVGTVERAPEERIKEARAERESKKGEATKEKNKTRGRSKIGRKLRKKQQNIIDERRIKLQQKLEEERQKKEEEKKRRNNETTAQKLPRALERFAKK